MSSDGDNDIDADDFYKCSNCGDNNLNNLVDEDGCYVCVQCGFVLAAYPMVPEHPDVVAQRSTRVFRRGDRNTYLRKAHIVERLNLAMCREPRIPNDRCALIYRFWRGSGADLPQSKADVRQLLRSLDKKRVDTTFPYCQKYLEKWKSIRKFIYELEGVPLNDVPSIDVLCRIGTVFDRMSKVWSTWQPRNKPREQWKFPERKHFPSFNLVIVRIHQLLDLPYDENDWPLPGVECIKKVTKYIDAMFIELDLPVYPLKN